MATAAADTSSTGAFTPRSKDTSSLTAVTPPIPYSVLSEKLLSTTPLSSPTNHGSVSLIVERPAVNLRNIVTTTVLHPEDGMLNSGWEERPGRGKTDQICVMSTAAIRTISGVDDHNVWAAAGDQLFIDFDLSHQNLSTGDLVKVGETLLRVSEKPHTGCGKFGKRYGTDALRTVAGRLAKERRIRGIYFEVVEGGVVKQGDDIMKVDADGTNV